MKEEDRPAPRSPFPDRVFGRFLRRLRHVPVLLLLCSGGNTAYGQETQPPSQPPVFDRTGRSFPGPMIAVHPGEHLFLEAGFGVGSTLGDFFFGMKGVTLSAEMKPGEPVIVAPRVTAWLTVIAAVGLGAGYYTDFDGGTFVIQPEFGLGLVGGRVTWRINLPVGKEIEGLNTSNLSVSVFLPVF